MNTLDVAEYHSVQFFSGCVIVKMWYIEEETLGWIVMAFNIILCLAVNVVYFSSDDEMDDLLENWDLAHFTEVLLTSAIRYMTAATLMEVNRMFLKHLMQEFNNYMQQQQPQCTTMCATM
ncbi:uncharacterized protein LOC128991668 [Macrosteles quadrilineatus]|uniref:uncharacterized protein LOC128991668 n=1 Tax=Macrosteles quadrilineatus TaxID=74068 RepID=UPI0023E175A8|nr:uncharacterized protein LOC128991668 [Macrosteles quadrilineatus]